MARGGYGEPWEVGAEEEESGFVDPNGELNLYLRRLNSLHSRHTVQCVTDPGVQIPEKLCDITMSCDSVTWTRKNSHDIHTNRFMG